MTSYFRENLQFKSLHISIIKIILYYILCINAQPHAYIKYNCMYKLFVRVLCCFFIYFHKHWRVHHPTHVQHIAHMINKVFNTHTHTRALTKIAFAYQIYIHVKFVCSISYSLSTRAPPHIWFCFLKLKGNCLLPFDIFFYMLLSLALIIFIYIRYLCVLLCFQWKTEDARPRYNYKNENFSFENKFSMIINYIWKLNTYSTTTQSI